MLKQLCLPFFAASLCFTFGGCSRSMEITPQDGGVESSVTDRSDSGPPIGIFGECDDDLDLSRRAECAYFEVPADWDSPNGDTRLIHVARLLSRSNNAPQLWMLQGGPGGSGASLLDSVTSVALNGLLDADLYFPDHRGTGNSGYLECSSSTDTPTGVRRCSQELIDNYGEETLASNTPTQSARDLDFVIDAVREQGRDVFVYGVSYGTYWLNRYLQLFPNKIQGAISDGLFFGPEADALLQDQVQEDALRALLQACDSDSFCDQRLGGDPVGFMRALIGRLENGHCPQIGTEFASRAMLAIGPFFAEGIPAVMARIDRCNAEDLTALMRLSQVLQGQRNVIPGADNAIETPSLAELFGTNPYPQSTTLPTWAPLGWAPEREFSDPLLQHLIVNELVRDPLPPPSAVTLAAQNIQLHRAPSAESLLLLIDEWQARYPREPIFGQIATTTIPWVWMNGELDFQTPLFSARRLADAANRELLEFPGNGHAVLFSRDAACAVEVVNALMAGSPDTSCVASVGPTVFGESAQAASALFGTTTLWP